MRNRLFCLAVLAILAACGNKQSAKPGAPERPRGKHPVASHIGAPCDSTGACPAGFFCNDNRECQQPLAGCAAGTLECPCAGGGCDSGLRCVDNVCRDNTGFAGGPCLDANHCHSGFRCSDGICVQCSPGTQGCTCSDGGSCNETLTCTDGMCVSSTGYATQSAAATSPSCVTPCSNGLTQPDGTYVACGSDGLLHGCLPGQVCQNGQCLAANDTAQTCTADVDCPHFEACLNSLCRGNCNADTDCQSGARCDHQVCRKTCDIAKGDCPPGLVCQAQDQGGLCMMSADGGPSPSPAAAALTLSATALRFSPNATNGQLQITNTSPFDATVVVRKYSQTEMDPVTKDMKVLTLVDRERAPSADARSCSVGSRGCACSSDASRPCQSLTPSYQLSCESNVCQLQTCTTGTLGCFCNGSDCRLLCDAGRCPLAWLKSTVSVDGVTKISGATDVVYTFNLPSTKTATITLNGAPQASPWSGRLEVEAQGSSAPTQTVTLRYANTPDGYWTGSFVYFGDFSVNEAALSTWPVAESIDTINNALLQRWVDFRQQAISYTQLSAILLSLRAGSWSKDLCPGTGWICYPFNNAEGWDKLSISPDLNPVPGGVVEMPFAFTLLPATGDPTTYNGAIDSSAALQYPGAPPIGIHFAGDPAACRAGGDGNCVTFLSSMQMMSVVGGRYPQQATCSQGFRAVTTPWLVPGFLGRSQPGTDGQSYLNECRESQSPFAGTDDLTAQRNAELAGANPLLDGTSRTRTLDFLDGAIINGDTMVILVREHTSALVASATDSDVKAYGVLILKRQSVAPTNVVPSPLPSTAPQPPAPTPPPACDPNLLSQINTAATTAGVGWTSTPRWDVVANALITGAVVPDSPTNVMNDANAWENPTKTEQVHYLCADTKLFDGGGAAGDLGSGTSCPADSRVTFFTVNPSQLSAVAVKFDSCQSTATCDQTFDNWAQQGLIIQGQPNWRCTDPTTSSCNANLFELRAGKTFYSKGTNAVLLPLNIAVDHAFLYRTQFQNRTGTGIGFTPSICGQTQQALPYCYSPDEIQKLEGRYDCLRDIFLNHYSAVQNTPLTQPSPMPSLSTLLDRAVRQEFSDRGDGTATTPPTPGFEMLRAELLIMLGDDAYTKALGSRFDLAAQNVGSFQGTQFEIGGINLSGVAGAEMFNLYLATQYYQMVLDRLATLLPSMWSILKLQTGTQANVGPTDGQEMIGQAAETEFLGHVIRASSQKATVFGELGNRYQNLNLPEIARHAIERGYGAGYFESMLLSTLMKDIANHSQARNVPQIIYDIGQAQLTYRGALSDMAERYRSITDEVDYFGLPSSYVPFPALDGQVIGTNAFQVAVERAKELIAIAQNAEDIALSTVRNYDEDAASFQSQLTQIVNTYENQLSDLCGTFTANGTVYPAIAKYAYLDPVARAFGDPCGHMGTGQLYQAVLNVRAQGKELDRIGQEIANVYQSAQIEEQKVAAQCATNAAEEQTVINLNNQALSWSDWQRGLQVGIDTIDRIHQSVMDVAQLIGTDPAAAAVVGTADVGFEGSAIELDAFKAQAEHQLQVVQNQQATVQFMFQCNAGGAATNDPNQPIAGTGQLEIEANAAIKTILLQATELQIEAARQQIQVVQALSQVKQLANEEQRMVSQMEQNVQNAIDVEAARNNPNVRIYKDDSVIQADLTFHDALQAVYKATRVFEYYTSQSYPDLQNLFLSRMVTRGDYNLQAYEIALENAFQAFEDEEGMPDTRVLILSLRDDILKVPYLNSSGQPISTNARVKLMQQKLSDPAQLDENGYVVVPFRIGPDAVSPLTRDHKIRYVEAQIIGGAGEVGRVYLRMAGGAMVSTLSDDLTFYDFPQRTGVINAFFSVKSPELDPTVYQTNRFVDRPLMNSRWEFVLNMKDEPANQDFTISDITDVRLFVYYSDFTKY